MTSYYAVLGVSRNASKAAIRAAYLQKAKRYHPDINQSPQAIELFKAVQEAYQVLVDDVKRQEFDQSDAGAGFEPHAETTKSNGSTSTHCQSNNAYRFRGRGFDPEAERERFNQDFYAQAEALRREMENETAELSSARRAAWRLYQSFGRYAVYFVLIPTSVIYITMRFYRRLRGGHPDRNSPILLDMYGRAYMMDQFGRRTRAPRYDNKKRMAQWETTKIPRVAQSKNHAADAAATELEMLEESDSGSPDRSLEGSEPLRHVSTSSSLNSQQPRSPSPARMIAHSAGRSSFPGCVDSVPPTAHRFADLLS